MSLKKLPALACLTRPTSCKFSSRSRDGSSFPLPFVQSPLLIPLLYGALRKGVVGLCSFFLFLILDHEMWIQRPAMYSIWTGGSFIFCSNWHSDGVYPLNGLRAGTIGKALVLRYYYSDDRSGVPLSRQHFMSSCNFQALPLRMTSSDCTSPMFE